MIDVGLFLNSLVQILHAPPSSTMASGGGAGRKACSPSKSLEDEEDFIIDPIKFLRVSSDVCRGWEYEWELGAPFLGSSGIVGADPLSGAATTE